MLQTSQEQQDQATGTATDSHEQSVANVVSPEIARPKVDGMRQITRPARALLGWMPPDQAHAAQLGSRVDVAAELAQIERAQAARETVAARSPGVNQTNVVSDLPESVAPYVARLRSEPAIAPYFAEGWEAQLVDLSRVCAIQPHVFSEAAEARTAGVEPGDLHAAAAVSLPMPVPELLPAQYDQSRQAWIFASANPNLRVVGRFGGEIQPGATGFGFQIAVLPSVLQVAEFNGRYLLRDGYHRAYGFLRRGITQVPAFVRRFATTEELALSPGMLPQTAFLGERPPALRDYLDDSVATTVNLPAAQKMIVVQALELMPLS